MKCSCCVECIRSWSDLQVFSKKNKLVKVAEQRVPVIACVYLNNANMDNQTIS